MGFWDWLKKPPVQTRKKEIPRRRHAGRKQNRFKARLNRVQKDVESVRHHLANHDVELAELKERTTRKSLERVIQDVFNRLQPILPPVAVGRTPSQSIEPESPGQPIPTDSNAQPPAAQQAGPRVTPTQRMILQALAEDGGDRFLSYADIGQLVYKSAEAVKYHINQMKQHGVQLEFVVSPNNQTRRYKINSRLKHLFGEHR